MSALKNARHVPAQAVRNIVDFLMFFYNGKSDLAAHEFIESHIHEYIKGKEHDDVTRRYEDFYRMTAYLIRETQWGGDEWTDVLDDFNHLEARYGGSGRAHSASVSKGKWQSIKLEIVFQLGLSHLRASVEHENDDTVSVPKNFDLDGYRKSIENVLRSHRKLYIIDADSGELHHKYQMHLDAFTTDLFTDREVSKKAAAKNKNGKRATLETVLDAEKVQDLLSQHSPAETAAQLVSFIQLIESKTMPVPIDVGTYVDADKQDAQSILRAAANRRLSDSSMTALAPPSATVPASSSRAPAVTSATRGVPPLAPASATAASAGRSVQKAQPVVQQAAADWDDNQADDFGPYAEQASPTPTPVPAPAAVPVAVAPGRTKAGKQKPAPKSPEVPDSPDAHIPSSRKSNGSAGVPIARAPVAAAVPVRGGAGSRVEVAVNHFKRKYDDIDPLKQAMGEDDDHRNHAASVKVSRESLVRSGAVAASSRRDEPAKKSKAASSSSSSGAPAAVPSSSKRGSKIVFDSDSEDPIEEDDEEREVTEVLEREGNSALQSLYQLQKKSSARASAFPDRLESPKQAKARARVSNKPNRTGQVRVKWTFEQEQMLEDAVRRYGEGNWANMLVDPEYAAAFEGRTNVNLKDKWRNLLKKMAPAEEDEGEE